MSLLRVFSKSLRPMTAMRVSQPLVMHMSTDTAAADDTDKGKKQNDGDVVIPELANSLEWVLHSPPPLHQFDEAPIIVETFGPKDPFH